jgi:2-polyprenyl-3-methyl-5-hydroxy-6-metoxy-1,4-benzoquinol methylase
MDDPDLDVRRHHRALSALARINVLSFSSARVWRRVEELYRDGAKEIRVLDVACGGGDVALAVKRRSQKAGIPVEVEGCDVSPGALAFAEARAQRSGMDVRFFQHDATDGPLPSGYDLVCSCLFLHHLSNQQAVDFLRELSRAGRTFLVQDLLRTQLGFLMALAGVRMVTRSAVVREDGPLSVRAAFSMDEARELVRAGGLRRTRIRRCWPERFTIDGRAR